MLLAVQPYNDTYCQLCNHLITLEAVMKWGMTSAAQSSDPLLALYTFPQALNTCTVS